MSQQSTIPKDLADKIINTAQDLYPKLADLQAKYPDNDFSAVRNQKLRFALNNYSTLRDQISNIITQDSEVEILLVRLARLGEFIEDLEDCIDDENWRLKIEETDTNAVNDLDNLLIELYPSPAKPF